MSKSIPVISVSDLAIAAPDDDSAILGFTAASWLAVCREAGPLFLLREWNRIVVAGEALSREMWKRGDDWGYADTSLGRIFRSQLGEGYITASDGDFHRDLRRSLRPLFAGACIHRHLYTIHRLLTQGFAALAGSEFDLHHQLIFLFTQGLNNTMLMSKAPDALLWRFAQFEEEFIRGGMLDADQRTAWYARPDYQQLRREVMGFFRTLVKARLNGERAGDNFDLLLDSLKAGGKLRDEDHLLLDAYLMQAAGAGNMAATSSRLLWVLLQNRQWLTQLRDEFAANDPRTALASGLAALPFMRTLLIENERRYPVTPAMPKLALCDIELGGHVIPQGSEVLHLFALSHFDSTLYDDPFAFRPERWLSGGLVRPHAFGGGEHLCLGMNLSTLFVVLTLQVLLQQGNLSAAGLPYSKPVADTPYAPTRPAFTISLTAPSSPL